MPLQSRATPVLITRPMPQADRFAKALGQRYGARALPVITPLMVPEFQPAVLPDGAFGSVVLTSETGAMAAATYASGLPKRAYCVGDRTAQVAAGSGFDAISAKGDADALVRLLSANRQHGPFLHLRGRESSGDLSGRLNATGVAATDLIVYAQEPRPLSEEARTLLLSDRILVVPMFSPRTAEIFRRSIRDMAVRALVRVAAISPAVAAVFDGFSTESIAIAKEPTQAELFLAMDRFIIAA